MTTANMNLDYPGLKAAYRVAALTKSPKGKPMSVVPNLVLVKTGTAAHFRALEVLGALKSGKIPGEFSNDGAAINAFELVDSPYLLGTGDATSTTNLSSATNWHAFDTNYKTDEFGLQYFESMAPALGEQYVVNKTQEIQNSAMMCYAYGHNDPRGTLHSTGANS